MNHDLAANVRELARPYTHTEQIPTWSPTGSRATREHRVRLPALLDQLHSAATPAGHQQTGAHARAGAPCRLDAIDTMRTIEAGTTAWQRRLQLSPRPSVKDRLAGLLAAHAALTRIANDLADELATDIHAWYQAARTATGWDTPPLPLRWQCPACAVHALRVRRDGTAAWCAHCGTRWDGTQVGLLAAQLHGQDTRPTTVRT